MPKEYLSPLNNRKIHFSMDFSAAAIREKIYSRIRLHKDLKTKKKRIFLTAIYFVGETFYANIS